MWMDIDDTVFVSLPGVPYEMRNLMDTEVIPRIQKRFKLPYILHKTILTYGMGESVIAERIAVFEEELPANFKLAYLPSLGRVRLRLSTQGVDKTAIEKAMQAQLNILVPQLSDIMIGYEDDGPMEQVIGQLLTERNKKLAIAESCTGGYLSQLFTKHSGASAYFRGGAVTYITETKTDILGVPKTLIDEHTVVSEAVAKAMATGAQKHFKSDYALATTGNAGPSKGDSDVEVGTVFIGLATPNGVKAYEFMMGSPRERVIIKTANKALELLRKEILKN